MREIITPMEKLNNLVLLPIMRFCGLYITPEGYICNSDSHEPYYDATDRKYVVSLNYTQYERIVENNEEVNIFDPFTQDRHLLLLMRFMQNAIFQLDDEFADFFETEAEGEYKEFTAEEISAEAEKRIKLLSFPADYKKIIRKRWVISTNLRNEIINKVISEVALPNTFSTNIGVLLSMLQICHYYDSNAAPIMNINYACNLAVEIETLIEKRGKKFKSNRKKYQETHEDLRKNQKMIVDKIGSKTAEKDINRSLEI